jgi:dTDP-glucose 4,6-dehydratase
MRILVTGGAGFIGSAVSRHLLSLGHTVAVADRFTYAGKGRNLADILPHIALLIGDLATGELAERCAQWQPEQVVHLAAETHVDHAIAHPERFLVSNALGTTRLLQALVTQTQRPPTVLVYSTDEVFGPTPRGVAFDEQAPFKHRLPVVIVRPCNTYGPRQHPEKAIPRFVQQLLAGRDMTLYNDGRGARDWLHVEDHARAIACLLDRGIPGEAYNLAAHDEHDDLDIATRIYHVLVSAGYVAPQRTVPWTLVPGRPGHDRRYYMQGAKLRALGWAPQVPFEQGFRDTVLWNARHREWWTHDVVRLGEAA